MTDLSAKFSALQTNLGGKLDTIIDKLDTLNSSLTALRGTGPENTIRSVNQSLWNLAGEAPGKTLTDLHTALRAAIGDNSVNTNSISALYNLLRDIQGTDITMSLTKMEQAEQAIVTSLQSGLYYDQGSFTTPWLNIIAGYLANPENAGTLYDMVSNMNAAIGGAPYSSLELGTVRGFLNAIMMNANNFGVLPDGSFENVIGSSSTLTDNNQRYVVWPAISGTERFDSDTRIERTTGNSWDGWELYIQTDSPDNAQFQTHLGVPELPTFLQITTNGWVPLDGPYGFRVSVEAQYQIRGYLRGNSAFTLQTIVATSQYGTINSVLWPTSFNAEQGITNQRIFLMDWHLLVGYTITAPVSWRIVYYATSNYNATPSDTVYNANQTLVFNPSTSPYAIELRSNGGPTIFSFTSP